MCDTILASPENTAEHVMLFGKNSDRRRNEAQAVEYFPQADHEPGSLLKCTYISIPQAARTHAVLLCRPFWIWGAEMGANEHGVAIGNEGIHARRPAPEEPALVGMDLLRLGLERASTAAAAVSVMTELLEQYGQGGNCGHLAADYYNNGFIVADPDEAFVLETVGREWLVERVHGVRTISNAYSIGSGAERVSAGLPALLRDFGWRENAAPDYAAVITHPNREHIGNAGLRRARSTALLSARAGRLNALNMMQILRDHGTESPPGAWTPQHAVQRTLCAHAGVADKPGQTVGSLVAELNRGAAVHWVTGTAAPCLSIFKPLFMDVPLPAHGPRPNDGFDPRTLWWRHEQLHRAAILGDFAGFLDEIALERDALEQDFHRQVSAVKSGSRAERAQFVNECWRRASDTEQRWHARIKGIAPADDDSYRATWLEMSRIAGIENFLSKS